MAGDWSEKVQAAGAKAGRGRAKRREPCALEPLGGGEEGVLTEQLEGWWDQKGSVRERQDRTWEVDSERAGPGHGVWAELRQWMHPKGREGTCDPMSLSLVHLLQALDN